MTLNIQNGFQFPQVDFWRKEFSQKNINFKKLLNMKYVGINFNAFEK